MAYCAPTAMPECKGNPADVTTHDLCDHATVVRLTGGADAVHSPVAMETAVSKPKCSRSRAGRYQWSWAADDGRRRRPGAQQPARVPSPPI